MDSTGKSLPLEADQARDARETRQKWPVQVKHLKDQSREGDLDGTTLEHRWDMMWPLAVTAWAFKGEDDADAERLPRRIARLIRGKR